MCHKHVNVNDERQNHGIYNVYRAKVDLTYKVSRVQDHMHRYRLKIRYSILVVDFVTDRSLRNLFIYSLRNLSRSVSLTSS